MTHRSIYKFMMQSLKKGELKKWGTKLFGSGYHIILIPQDAQKTRRVQLSPLTTRLMAMAGLLIFPVIVGSLFTTLHYQNSVVSLKRKISEDRQLLQEKEVLAIRLSSLERSLKRTEYSLGGLEKALDVDVGQVKSGLGPLDNHPLSKKKLASIPLLQPALDSLLENGDHLDLASIRQKMTHLNRRIDHVDSSIDEIFDLNQDKIRLLSAIPDRMPVNGWVTSDFGFRRSPYSGRHKMHNGIDIASPIGVEIRAPADGYAILARFEGGYGRKIILDHGYGITTVYGHASKIFVKEGVQVKKGEVIAAVGSSGASTGPHLHYEVHVDGIPTDPLYYLKKH